MYFQEIQTMLLEQRYQTVPKSKQASKPNPTDMIENYNPSWTWKSSVKLKASWPIISLNRIYSRIEFNLKVFCWAQG